ncbi:MAG: divalent-cation tolerance protein CutA [Deltaproteobacteria bacterium]|nr:divalent-cation tolerance protein CutA [Deltaproteobacteria bacterium]
MSCVLAITATDSIEAARTIGAALVDEHLVACVNILAGATSIYRWQGKRCEAGEHVLLMKTTADRVPALQRRLPELHSYECPELIVLPITDGFPPYLAWVAAATQSNA